MNDSLDRSCMARANSELSDHVKARSILIKAQFSALNVAAERGTSDKMHTCQVYRVSRDYPGFQRLLQVSQGNRGLSRVSVSPPESRN